MPQKDFQQIINSPSLAYDEGLRFFMGEGTLNDTLHEVVRDLENNGIEYCIIGAVALNIHGYRRFTEDIDLLLSKEGLEQFRKSLIGAGYRPLFEGATKRFRQTRNNVTVEIITDGEFPGDGKPKSVEFPKPGAFQIEIDGIKTLPLDKLIELKLASGMTAPDRLKDLADVQEMIKIKGLPTNFAEKLDPYVREKFLELQQAVEKHTN